MPQVIVNPDELRRFANYLDELTESLRANKAQTFRSYEHLRQTWKDAKFNQFDKLFNSTCKDLDDFLRSTKSYADYLRMKAAKADRFLSH